MHCLLCTSLDPLRPPPSPRRPLPQAHPLAKSFSMGTANEQELDAPPSTSGGASTSTRTTLSK